MSQDELPAWRQQRRQRILDAASALFARQPYETVQTDEIARAAGIGKATLYRYFPSKEGLYLESFQSGLAVMADRIRLAALAGDPPPAVLAEMLRCLADTLSEQLQPLRLMGGDVSHLADRSRRILRDLQVQIADPIQQVIQAGIADGSFGAVDAALVPMLLIGAIRGGVMSGRAASPADLARAVIELVLGPGLRPAVGPEQRHNPPLSLPKPALEPQAAKRSTGR